MRLLIPPRPRAARRVRQAQLYLDLWRNDDEVLSDDIVDPGPEYHELELGPHPFVQTLHRTYTRDGVVRLECDISVRLLAGEVVDVRVDGLLSRDAHDLDGIDALTLRVQSQETGAAAMQIGDVGRLIISARNVLSAN